jgi:hypothetical protein
LAASVLFSAASSARAEDVLRCPNVIVDTKVRKFRRADLLVTELHMFPEKGDPKTGFKFTIGKDGVSQDADNIPNDDGDLCTGDLSGSYVNHEPPILLCKYSGTIVTVPLYVPQDVVFCSEFGYCN